MSAWMNWPSFGPAVIWTALTLACWAGAVALFQRSGGRLWLLPVVSATAAVGLLLVASATPHAVYAQATQGLSWLGGPAIVSLAVPLQRQGALLRRQLGPLAAALAVGCGVSMASTWGLAQGLGLPSAWQAALLPKSATLPLALASAQRLGGEATLAALAVVVTGVTGTLALPLLARLLRRPPTPEAEAFTLGLAAHAIGAARVAQRHPAQLGYAVAAMGLHGVATAVAAMLLAWAWG